MGDSFKANLYLGLKVNLHFFSFWKIQAILKSNFVHFTLEHSGVVKTVKGDYKNVLEKNKFNIARILYKIIMGTC